MPSACPPPCPAPPLPASPAPPPRRLQFTNGTVHVKATYDKSYELILMPLQAAVLLAFNDSEALACSRPLRCACCPELPRHARLPACCPHLTIPPTLHSTPTPRAPVACAVDAAAALSYGELKEASKLPDEDLVRCLASLCLSKYKLLTKVRGALWGSVVGG